jgi:hypothetical protein
LHAVAAVVPRITVPTLVAFWEGWIGFEVGAGQIIEQYIEDATLKFQKNGDCKPKACEGAWR